MSIIRTKLLANEIIDQLRGATDGHCARVDFLERVEAMTICHYLAKEHERKDIAFHILTPRDTSGQNDTIFITTDEAIGIRNRKHGRLCLFVPSDLIDAAYSSLANSFALIDGRKLHETALKRIMRRLPDAAQKVLRVVSRGTLLAGYEQRLDYAMVALELEQAGE